MAPISILVPVYNAKKYLDRCMESILCQSFADFTALLIDDGSTDGSSQLCDDYARRDSRVHVLHQKNAGAAAARNAGLDWAEKNRESQWICFVDSDDWIHPQMLQQLYHAAVTLEAPISVCGYVETEEQTLWEDAPIPQAEMWSPEDFYIQRNINATVPWGKLYRRECFAGERFAEGKYLDDEFLIYRLLFQGDRLAVISAPLYGYFVNREGLTKRAWNPRLLYAWEAYEQQIAFFDARGEENLVRFRYRAYIENAVVNLAAVQSAPNAREWKPILRKMKKQLRSMLRRAWKRGYLHFWIDYDFLYAICPIQTKLYRFWLDKLSGGNQNG